MNTMISKVNVDDGCIELMEPEPIIAEDQLRAIINVFIKLRLLMESCGFVNAVD